MRFVQTSWHRFAGLVAVIAMLASLVSVPAAAQADGNTYTFSNGQELAWTGGWTLDPDSVTQEEGIEIVLLSQQLSFLAVLSVPAGADLDATRDAFLEGFLGAGDDSVTIDRGSYGAVSYSLDTIDYDGVAMGAFTLFRSGQNGGDTFAWVFVALVESFASQFSEAQGDFTLDGNPPFTGIDGQGLQDQLVAAGGSGTTSQTAGETPTATSTEETPESGTQGTGTESTPEGGETTTSGSGGLKGGNTSTGSTEPTAEVEEPTAEAGEPTTEATTAAGEVGLIDDSTFVSPAYNVTVEWDSSFILDPSRDANPSASTDGVEVIGLSSPTEGTPYFVTVTISATTLTAADFAAYWASDEFLAENALSPESEVLLVEGDEEIAAVITVDYLEDGTPIIYYNEFQVDAETGTAIRFQYFTAAALVDTTLPLAQVGITVDGAPALSFFSTEEVVEAAAGI